MSKKAMTIRLDTNVAVMLDLVARAEGITVTDFIREAIYAEIYRRRQDPDFKVRLQDIHVRDKEIFDQLMSGNW